MHGEVLTYNSGTGVLTVDINHHTGSGTYTAWVVNVGGVTPATSVAWGSITGTLSSQTDLQNALDLKLAATTAASTYQTLSGMSSYLTTSAAASTYQTQAGMSSYLTTSTAASTYALKTDGALKGNFTLDGTAASPNSDGSILIGSLSSGYNYLSLQAGVIQGVTYASGNKSFTLNGLEGLKLFSSGQGVRFPDATTQTTAYPGSSDFLLKADNLSGLANTGTARTNLGLGTMAVETASNYLTTASASSTYFTIANAANKADLASPTFTGTPTLPTGTIGVTQTAGNNTTALATTAFVTAADNLKANLASPALTGTPTAPTATAGTNTTQIATTAFVTSAVPAAATHTQALQFSSTSAFTKVIDASSQLIAPSVLKVWPSPSNYNGTATSGAGASAVLYLTGYVLTSPNAGVAGNARAFHGNISGDLGGMLWGGSSNTQINFGRRVSMAFRFSQFPSSTESVTRVLLGKIHGTAVGDLTSRGIGVKYVPNGANFDFQLQVHNGTTLTSVTSSTQYAGGVADLEVVSDGAGNATLYLNGASVATTTGAPTGQTGANATVFAEIESTASTANKPSAAIGRLYVNSLNF
jgi:hypothetical protein